MVNYGSLPVLVTISQQSQFNTHHRVAFAQLCVGLCLYMPCIDFLSNAIGRKMLPSSPPSSNATQRPLDILVQQ